MPNEILVTGAAGFIGWRTSEFLLDGGYNVIGIDNIDNYYDITLKEYRLSTLRKYPNFRFYKRDIRDISALEEVFKENHIEAVINLAARAGVRASIEAPHLALSTNAGGTLNLLELMKKYNIKKMVLASTSSIYAGQRPPFKESLPANTPVSPYAASKKAAEVMAYTYSYLFGLDITVLRYFTVYGPAGRPDMSVLRFIKLIDEGKDIVLFGDGSQRRDFTYIDDIADGTIRALRPTGYKILNLGAGNEPIPLKTLISFIEEHLGKKARLQIMPFQKADMTETQADISEAEKTLGWRPKTDFSEGIKKTIHWYIENLSWLKSLKL